MLKQFISTGLVFCSISITSCTPITNNLNPYNKQPIARSQMNNETSAPISASIVGTWILPPLNNSIGEVVEYTKDGEYKTYNYFCDILPYDKFKDIDSEKGSATYKLDADTSMLTINTDGEIKKSELISIGQNTMTLREQIEGTQLDFLYFKTNNIKSFCDSKQSAYKASDFIPNPWIPKHPHLDRYVGDWVTPSDNIVQIAVRKNNKGEYYLYEEDGENWKHLYNNIYWKGDELHYQHFAYSNKKELYKHPYHKSVGHSILTPTSDSNKIKHSYYINAQRYDHILKRK